MRTKWILFTAVFVLIAGLITAYFMLGKTVILSVNGRESTVFTRAITVGSFLRSEQVSLSELDEVSPDLKNWLSDGDVVEVIKARPIVVLDRGNVRMITTTKTKLDEIISIAGLDLVQGDWIIADGLDITPDDHLSIDQTHSLQIIRINEYSGLIDENTITVSSSKNRLGSVLFESGYHLFVSDFIQPGFDSILRPEEDFEIISSRRITLLIAGDIHRFRTNSSTIGDALSQAGFSVQGLDYTIPSLKDPIPRNGEINLIRMNEETTLIHEPIAYESIFQPDPDLEIDRQRLLQAGTPGQLTRKIRIRYENEEEVSRNIEEVWTSVEPAPQITGYGTKVVVRTIDTPDGRIEYWRALTMYATSYSPCRLTTNSCNDTTYSGRKLTKGVAGVIRSWYPYFGGTSVYVPGYGKAIIGDIGGGVPGKYWIDLGYTDEEWVSWHHNVTVYFLTPIPANIAYILP